MQALGKELEAATQTQGKQPLASVRTAVAGVGGYSGGELARLLLAHPRLAANKPLFLVRVADDAAGGGFWNIQHDPPRVVPSLRGGQGRAKLARLPRRTVRFDASRVLGPWLA